MIMNKIKSLIAIVGLSLLSACGGGGDGGGGGTPAPVASTSVFNLQAAYKSDNATSSSNRLTITGMQGTSPVSGNATAETGAVTSGTFEGQPALQQRTIIFGSITFNNQTVPISWSKISWMDTNYMPRGQSQSGKEYTVVDGTATLPTAAKVNDTGAFFTAKSYTTSDKTTLLATKTVTYLMEADTATTALVTLITVVKNNAGNTIGTTTNQYRVTTANVFTRIKETAVDNTNGSSLTYTVIY